MAAKRTYMLYGCLDICSCVTQTKRCIADEHTQIQWERVELREREREKIKARATIERNSNAMIV